MRHKLTGEGVGCLQEEVIMGKRRKSILPIQQKAEVNFLDHRAIQDGSISSQEAREKSSASDLFCLRFERPTKLVITEHVQNSF